MRRGAGHKDGRGGGGGTLRSLGFFRGSVQTASAVLHRVGRGFIGRSRARNLRMERARLRLFFGAASSSSSSSSSFARTGSDPAAPSKAPPRPPPELQRSSDGLSVLSDLRKRFQVLSDDISNNVQLPTIDLPELPELPELPDLPEMPSLPWDESAMTSLSLSPTTTREKPSQQPPEEYRNYFSDFRQQFPEFPSFATAISGWAPQVEAENNGAEEGKPPPPSASAKRQSPRQAEDSPGSTRVAAAVAAAAGTPSSGGAAPKPSKMPKRSASTKGSSSRFGGGGGGGGGGSSSGGGGGGGGAVTGDGNIGEPGDPKRRVLFCSNGSRGDVQPLIALAAGMLERGGYEVAFWTARPVDELVRKRGIKCFVHDLNADDLMRRTQIKINQSAILDRFGRGLGFFAALLDASTEDEFAPAIDTIPDSVLSAHIEYRPDLTITSQCMPAISCAEFLHIPVVYIALQPMYPTKEFPPWTFHVGRFEDKNAWMHKPLGQLFLDIYDHQTYVRGVKRCRALAGLPVDTFSDGSPVQNLRFVPTCNAISSGLLPPPTDWPRWQRVCGFLMEPSERDDAGATEDASRAKKPLRRTSSFSFRRLLRSGSKSSLSGRSSSSSSSSGDVAAVAAAATASAASKEAWEPPRDLVDFLDCGAKPVYMGFGSMCGDEQLAVHITRVCLRSLMNAGQRGILLGGWAGLTRERLDPAQDAEVLEYARANVHEAPSCPHAWLFPRCSAVVHHGGAGTLAVGLRSGCPTVICPFIFDQEYFGRLIEEYRCGVVTAPARDLTLEELTAALKKVLEDGTYRAGTAQLAHILTTEHGVANAIDFIEEIAASFPFPWPIRLPSYRRDEEALVSGGAEGKEPTSMKQYFDRQQLDQVALKALYRSPLASQMNFMLCNDQQRKSRGLSE